MKRRVYVMDCGEIVKIGVSKNPENRKNQIPYKVKQYYCTKPIENPFDVERKMHSLFRMRRNCEAFGREYFDIPFTDAVKELMNIIEGNNNTEKYGLKIKLVGGDGKQETEKRISEKIISLIPKMSDFDKGYILGKVESMAEQKKEDTSEDDG